MSYRPFVVDGIVPIIPTPFLDDGRIDFEQIDGLIDFARAAGACAACLPAYGSEFYKLSESERLEVTIRAARHSSGTLPIIGQVNYPSAHIAATMAATLQAEGIDAIGVTVPRLFPVPEADLRRYFDTVLNAVHLPVIIQDFNPGGESLSVPFVAALNRHYPQFRYLKLEQPMMAGKVRAILEATEARVGVIEGWGGMYILELVRAGICGVMPGLALTDVLERVYRLASGGNCDEAADLFEGILPQIVFSLQNLELYHCAEKSLLQSRGVLRACHVRDAGLRLSGDDQRHIEFLNKRVIALLSRLQLPLSPLAREAATR
jgi:dihydrodipicolinate synthase/N-acetylneuraminate lyase